MSCHVLDWGICGDTCYECAKIRVIDALQAYFLSEATSLEQPLRVLDKSQPECERCKQRAMPAQAKVTVQLEHEGRMYIGMLTAKDE